MIRGGGPASWPWLAPYWQRSGTRRFLIAFASVSLGNYGAIAMSFLISVALTRALGAEEYGRFALLLTVSQVLVVFVTAWSLTGLVRFGAREHATSGAIAETFWSRAVLVGPSLAAAVGVLLGAAPFLGAVLGVATSATLVVIWHLLGATVASTANGALQALGRMSLYGIALLVERAVSLVAILAVSRLAGLDAVGAVAIYAISGALVGAWVFRSIGARALLPIRASRSSIGALWRFSLPVAASSWAGLLGTQWIDLAMLRYFLDLVAVGRYALAYQLAGALLQIAFVMSTLLLPRYSVMAQREPEELRREVGRTVPYWLFAFSLGAAIAVAAAGPLVPLAFGPDFAPAVPALGLLLVATSAAAIASICQALLAAHGIMWPLTGAIVASVATNVVLNAVLIPPLGIVGAAAATLAAYGLSAALMLSVVRLRIGLGVLRYALFVLPAAAVHLAWLTLGGIAFWLATVVVVTAAAVGLAYAFGLFRTPRDTGAVGSGA